MEFFFVVPISLCKRCMRVQMYEKSSNKTVVTSKKKLLPTSRLLSNTYFFVWKLLKEVLF